MYLRNLILKANIVVTTDGYVLKNRYGRSDDKYSLFKQGQRMGVGIMV